MSMSALQAADTAVHAKLLESSENSVAAGSDRTTCTSRHREQYQFFTLKEKARVWEKSSGARYYTYNPIFCQS